MNPTTSDDSSAHAPPPPPPPPSLLTRRRTAIAFPDDALQELRTRTESPGMSSLFGSNTAAQGQSQPQQSGTGLFGSSTAQNQPAPGGSLFGSNTGSQQNQGGSLFASNTGTQQNQSGGLFGSSTTQQSQPSGTGGLFGSNTATQQNQGGSLFGGANQPSNTGSSLFGGNTTTQNQPQSTGLFGNTAQTQPSNTGTSLFGNTQQNTSTNTAPSLFGNTTSNTQSNLFQPQQSQQQPQQQQTTPSLFQPSTLTPQTQPQQTHLSTLFQSGLGTHTTAFGTLGTTSQQDLARSRLADANITSRPNEKPLLAQIQTLIRKWEPNSTDTLMQKYLYNAVNSAYAPFYYRNADEGEEEWEKALAEKPAPISSSSQDGAGGGGGENISFIPVLVRGFHALGQRIEYQARTLNEMRARLHEMNNSLDSVMKSHAQSITVRLSNAQRQHAALGQRCLRLAVKAQTLRQRGYPLDAAEEALRRTLRELEGAVFDPSFVAREEEVWARMVRLRERGRWLEEEGRRVGGIVREEQGRDGGGLSEEVLRKTRGILRDYDGQIELLKRELEEVRREFEGLEGRR